VYRKDCKGAKLSNDNVYGYVQGLR